MPMQAVLDTFSQLCLCVLLASPQLWQRRVLVLAETGQIMYEDQRNEGKELNAL